MKNLIKAIEKKPILLLWIGIALAVIVSLIKSLFSRQAPGDPKQVRSEINALIAAGIVPSYQQTQYGIYADQIFAALDGSGIADSEKTAERILKEMKNDLDVLYLIRSYGTRNTHWFGIPGPGMTLPQVISDEFTQTRISRVNADYQSKGITYRF